MNTKETSMQWSRRSKSGFCNMYSQHPKYKRDFRPGCWFIIPHSRTETRKVTAILYRLGIIRVRNKLCRSL
jgi:hypothetical protein